jgi:4'-phosphopantetheinyl transferase
VEGSGTRALDLEGEAHLWLAQVTPDIEPSILSSWWDLLSGEERERHGSFLNDAAKLQYLTAWALARTSLSRYADVKPQAWRFRRRERGRPEIVLQDEPTLNGPPPPGVPVASAAAHSLPPLRFNLSHSGGLVACLVTFEADVGVDIESTQRNLDMVRLADRFFSPEEAGEVRSLTGPERDERFFAYWTLKEAYLKARGRGLSIPLRQASFRLSSDAKIDVRFDPRLEDREDDWQFDVLRPSQKYLLAAAIRRGQMPSDHRHISIVAREVVPLVREEGMHALPVVASTSR